MLRVNTHLGAKIRVMLGDLPHKWKMAEPQLSLREERRMTKAIARPFPRRGFRNWLLTGLVVSIEVGPEEARAYLGKTRQGLRL